MGYRVGRISLHAVSRWSRSPGCCGYISWCVFLVSRGISFFFFVFFTSNAHGLLQVRGNLASCTSLLVPGCVQGAILFERSEFLIDTCYIPKKKSVRVCVCVCSTNLGFSVEKNVLVLVWGTSERLVPAKKKQNAWYQRALRCQLRGRPFHSWAGRLRFSGEAHPGPATFNTKQ